MASSSAAERAEGCPELRKRRGEVVVLVFSQQGAEMGLHQWTLLLMCHQSGWLPRGPDSLHCDALEHLCCSLLVH